MVPPFDWLSILTTSSVRRYDKKGFRLEFQGCGLFFLQIFTDPRGAEGTASRYSGFYILFFSYSVHIKIMQKDVENYGIKIVKKLHR